jgi:hypothetical protein
MIFPNFETKKEFCVSFFSFFLLSSSSSANTCTQENVRALTAGLSEALKGRAGLHIICSAQQVPLPSMEE